MFGFYANAFTHRLTPIVDVLMRVLAHILVPMFLVGMAGAAIVVAITVVQDILEFLIEDETEVTVAKS